MAVEKQRVLDRFNPKYGTVSMPKPKLDAMAAKFSLLIADGATDEDIDLFLDTMNEAHSFKDIAADEHRKATPPKPNPPTPAPTPAPTPQPSPNPIDDEPAWLKSLKDTITGISSKLESLESEKQQSTIQTKVKSLIGTEVPESWLKGKALPGTMEEVEAWVTEQKQAYTDFVQENFNSSVGKNRPVFGAPGAGKKEASKEEVEAVVANMNI